VHGGPPAAPGATVHPDHGPKDPLIGAKVLWPPPEAGDDGVLITTLERHIIMDSSFRPWAATITARLTRSPGVDTTEIVEYAHEGFTRRFVGVGGPPEPLDEQACRDLLDDLRGELDALPADVDRDDLVAFTRILDASLALAPTG
jgi:hypothetical protein